MDESLPALIQQMLEPRFYAHFVNVPIQLLQTHISDVLLTGEYVYKIKKPVNFGFLDFSTLEKRHYYCQEEFRLNQRFSPALYLAVLPITQDSKGLYRLGTLDPNANIVEYALQMRQFPQNQLFSDLFQAGKLTSNLIRELGVRVATFHAQANTNAEIQTYGSPTAILQASEYNYSLSQGFISPENLSHPNCTQTQQQYNETRTFTHQFCQDHADWLIRRQTEAKIRECHGDLHLNNVCLYQGKIQLFDCIEFNREFRNIDVIYDMAFMMMDLDFHDRSDLSNLFLNTYLEQTGDYWGVALLPLYLSMRAYIRGNVNSLALQDPAISETDKMEFRQRGHDYYDLAWRYTRRTLGAQRTLGAELSPGSLTLMSGLSGSGKSTVARQLAQRINAIQIRSDVIRKHLAGIPLDRQELGPGESAHNLYTPEMTQRTYDRLLELGLFLAEQGWPVILDAKYDQRCFRQTVMDAANRHQLPVQIVQCTAPDEILRDRLRMRTDDVSDATVDLLDAQRQASEPLTEAEWAIATLIQTANPLDPQLDLLISERFTGHVSNVLLDDAKSLL